MRYARIALVMMLVLGAASTGSNKEAASESNLRLMTESAAPTQGGSPNPLTGIFPNKELFVTQEDDAFLVSIGAECPPDSANTAKFDLVPPTPGFVKISSACRCELGAISIAGITVAPHRGDAGKYTVAVRATSCTGFVGTTTFQVKVKRTQG